jgi:hypothetical protein
MWKEEDDPNLRYSFGILLEGQEHHENFTQVSRGPGQDSNGAL